MQTLRYMLGRTENPLYHREKSGWIYGQAVRTLQRGCAPLTLVVLAGIPALCALMVLPSVFADPDTALIIMPFTVLFGIYLAGELILFGASLAATVYGSTVISAEVEGQTLGSLRMTPLEPREVVLAKFGSVFHRLKLPTAVTTVTRLLFFVGMIVYVLVLALIAVADESATGTGFSAPAASVPVLPSLPVLPLIVGSTAAVILILMAVAAWLLVFFLQPVLRISMFSALSVFASSLARSRSTGLVTAIFFRIGYFVASYTLSQMLSSAFSLLALPILALPLLVGTVEQFIIAQPLIALYLGLFAAIVTAVLAIMGSFGVTLLVLHWAGRRTGRLPFDIG
ncbi:MAG: hypothetical protein ACFB51_14685 [Anaerolineae bacterium]